MPGRYIVLIEAGMVQSTDGAMIKAMTVFSGPFSSAEDANKSVKAQPPSDTEYVVVRELGRYRAETVTTQKLRKVQ